VLALAAVLAPLSAPVAQSAPPQVSAPEDPLLVLPLVVSSENPVVMHSGQTTKTITLTWSLGPGWSAANLTVSESGTPAPVINNAPVFQPPGKGTVPLTVTHGKTYTAQLYEAFTGKPLSPLLTITTSRPGPLGP
jgi:hypothetical protein